MVTGKSGISRWMSAGAVPALLLLAACGPRAASNDSENALPNEAGATIEDVSPDSLVAPENMPLDEESRSASENHLTGNAASAD